MAIYCNTLEGNMQYGDDPYCFTPSTNRFNGSILKENVVVRLLSRRIFLRKPYLSCRSLLLSTSVLNDNTNSTFIL